MPGAIYISPWAPVFIQSCRLRVLSRVGTEENEGFSRLKKMLLSIHYGLKLSGGPQESPTGHLQNALEFVR